jgi:tRNA (guanine-N7-)-methyltransferase
MALFATMEQVTDGQFRQRSFRLRGERMTKAQSEALYDHWNKFEVPLHGTIEPHDLFPSLKPTEVVFEVGSGMGEATSQIAANNPETGYVAVEVHKPGIGALIIRAENLGVRNLKIINADIYEVLTKHVRDNTVDAFHIFFPDPWPKRKQHKRRLLQPEFIEILAQKLLPGGRINIATDWYPYAQEIEKNFLANSKFSGGVIVRPQWRPLTKFESKGITKQHVVTDFEYRKNS